jgi:hypothetical protein
MMQKRASGERGETREERRGDDEVCCGCVSRACHWAVTVPNDEEISSDIFILKALK